MNITKGTITRTTKFQLLAISVLLLVVVPSKAQIITSLAGLGEVDFAVEESVTSAPYTQSATGINFNSSFTLGSTLGGLFLTDIPKDWSSYSLNDFGLIMRATGNTSTMPFTLELYDNELNIASIFQGSTAELTETDTFVPMVLSSTGSGSMDSIVGLQFTWDAPDSINAEWREIAVVPEPSVTNLLLLTSSGLLLLLAIKHRKSKV
jgi:hypothetical protein